MTARVFLGVGSNLGDRQLHLERAVRGLDAMFGVKLMARASTHETVAVLPPGDNTPQPNYLNTVVEIETTRAHDSLLSELKVLEGLIGRVPGPRWSARVIDIDILLFGSDVVTVDGLSIPHPEMHRRRFVLEPLCEIAPDVLHPVLRLSARELLSRL